MAYILATSGWIANKVVKENMTADPSSEVMNYVKFTAGMAAVSCWKSFLKRRRFFQQIKKISIIDIKWPALQWWSEVQFLMLPLPLVPTTSLNICLATGRHHYKRKHSMTKFLNVIWRLWQDTCVTHTKLLDWPCWTWEGLSAYLQAQPSDLTSAAKGWSWSQGHGKCD